MKLSLRFTMVLTTLVLLPLLACEQAAQPSAGNKQAKSTHLVEVVTVISLPLGHSITRTGTLMARRQVKIFSLEEGRIDTLSVYQGDAVVKNQLLIQLDSRLLKAELEQAMAIRLQAESDVVRSKNLVGKKLAPEDQLNRAQTALRVARAQQGMLETRLEYAEIRAPFDGVITERRAEPGDVVSRHSHLLTLIDADTLYTQVPVSELLLPDLHIGDKVGVRIDALGGETVSGKILRIHPTVDPRTRQGIVEVLLTPVPRGAVAGQLCRVTLRTPEVQRLVLPFAALRRDQDSEFVFLLEDGKAVRRAIRTGLRLGGRLEVLEGLEDGQRVVIRGFLGLSNGKRVKVTGTGDELSTGQPDPVSPHSPGKPL